MGSVELYRVKSNLASGRGSRGKRRNAIGDIGIGHRPRPRFRFARAFRGRFR